MAKSKKCVIITPVLPGDSSVGEIWLRDICKALDGYSLSLIVASHLPITAKDSPYPLLSLKIPELPPTRHIFRRLISPITINARLRQIADETDAFISTHQPDVALIVPFGYSNIAFCAKMIEKLQIPIVALIWDPLELQVQYGKLDLMRWANFFIKRNFYNIIRLSTHCLVMSDEMGADYQQYSKTIVIRGGIPADMLAQPEDGREDIYYQIGFAGSLHGIDSFQAFVEALDKVGWVINDRPVRFIIIGTSLLNVRMRASKPAEIVWLGRHSQAETIKLLNKCHMLYLPYPMDVKSARTVQMSFPTKLSTYVAANAAIFYHGPENSTVAAFVAKYPIAIVCSETDHYLIIQRATELLTNDRLRNSIKAEQRTVFEEAFSSTQFKVKVVSAIESALT